MKVRLPPEQGLCSRWTQDGVIKYVLVNGQLEASERRVTGVKAWKVAYLAGSPFCLIGGSLVCTGHPPSGSGLLAGTIHSYCLQMLQSSGRYEMHDVLTEGREWALLHRFARRLGPGDLFEKTWPGTKTSLKVAVDTFLDNLTAVYGDDVDRRALAEANPGFAGVLSRYEQLLHGMRLVSFDQMISAAANEMRPGGVLRRTLEGRVREVLVDEYQDLNRAQERLLPEFLSMSANLREYPAPVCRCRRAAAWEVSCSLV